jgi:hypothetical protein
MSKLLVLAPDRLYSLAMTAQQAMHHCKSCTSLPTMKSGLGTSPDAATSSSHSDQRSSVCQQCPEKLPLDCGSMPEC